MTDCWITIYLQFFSQSVRHRTCTCCGLFLRQVHKLTRSSRNALVTSAARIIGRRFTDKLRRFAAALHCAWLAQHPWQA
jgi:hypothetical protein